MLSFLIDTLKTLKLSGMVINSYMKVIFSQKQPSQGKKIKTSQVSKRLRPLKLIIDVTRNEIGFIDIVQLTQY